jgi:hypothetical protein
MHRPHYIWQFLTGDGHFEKMTVVDSTAGAVDLPALPGLLGGPPDVLRVHGEGEWRDGA